MSSLEIDAQLVVQAQNGDAAARHRILACVAAWLPRAAALRYPYLDERADLCQEVLLQVHLGLDRIQDPACFTAWAYGVLRNCSWARVRAERRDHSVVVEHPELHAAVAEHSLSSTRTPEELASRSQAWERGRAALASLNPKLREVYALYLEGHTLSEIAAMLSLPRGTVASRLRTGQAMVRRKLGIGFSSGPSPKVHRFPHQQGG